MKSYTDLEQSKKLSEILPLETADMRYHTISNYNPYPCNEIVYTVDFGKISHNDIPCWSLAALLKVFPNYQLQTQDDGIGILCSYNEKFNIVTADNSVDACYKMIVKLKEQNLI